MECFIIILIFWVFSVCLHEFGHAIVAYRGGDHTVADKGYLSMNPLKYTHPVYSILMPLVFLVMGGIGLPGGAVYIEKQLLRSRAWETAVALAGPATQVPIILLIALAFRFGWLENDLSSMASLTMGFLLQLEVSSLILNLLPVPPLDGFQAIAPWLPPSVRDPMYSVSRQAPWVLFLLIAYYRPANAVFWNAVYDIDRALGVNPSVGYEGFKAFRSFGRGHG